MNIVYVRPADQGDVQQFLSWEAQNEGNGFDPAAPLYESSFTLCAFDSEGALAYMPVQQPMFDTRLMLESVCFRPEATELQKATALKELIQTCVFLGHTNKAGEIYFVGTNESTNAFAERYGFEKLDWPVYRLRLNAYPHESRS